MAKNWYNIKNQATDNVEIEIYDSIGEGGITAKDFINDIKGINPASTITLRINSFGGSVIDGFAIYNYLNDMKNYIVVKVDGIAASIASIIALAGDTLIMPDNSLFMIHDPYYENEEAEADGILKKIKSQLVNIYVTKCKKPAEEIIKLMNLETWFTGTEAMAYGFADSTVGSIKISNNVVDPTKLTHIKNKEKFMTLVQENKIVDETTTLEVVETEIKTLTVVETTGETKEEEKTEEVVPETTPEATPEVVEDKVDPTAELKIDIENKAKSIKELTDELDATHKSVADLENKVTTLENKVTELTVSNTEKDKVIAKYIRSEATAFINSVVEIGKIKDESKEQWITRYEANKEDCLNILNSIVAGKSTKNAPINVVKKSEYEGLKGLELSIAVAKANGGKIR